MDKIFTLQHSFENLVQQGIQQVKQLLDVLEQEYLSLQHTDPERLENIIQQKDHLLKDVVAFAEKQNHLLIQMGYPADKGGIGKLLHDIYDDNEQSQLWNNFQELLNNCQKQNEINSGVISLSKRQTTNALDLLYGFSAGGKTYGPTGESLSSRSYNSLGKA